MRERKLILVEGMPGTGKSTVSQFISLQLLANGRHARWCHEECAHPVRLFYEPERHLTWAGYCDDALSRWQSFSHELLRLDQVAVLDAAILQNHVRSMMIFCCDRNAICEIIRRIESLIAPLDPDLIYLKPKAVGRNFREIVEVRGQRMLELWIEAHDRYPCTQKAQLNGYPGLIAFWKEFDEIADRAFDGFAHSKLQLHVSNDDWGTRYARILDFLKLPLSSNSTSSEGLERFVGKYEPSDDHAGGRFILQAGDGCLIGSVDQPTVDVHGGPIGCYREVRLIPKGKNHFYITAWPHEVLFTEDRFGTIVNFRVIVNEDGWAQTNEVYVKQSSLP